MSTLYRATIDEADLDVLEELVELSKSEANNDEIFEALNNAESALERLVNTVSVMGEDPDEDLKINFGKTTNGEFNNGHTSANSNCNYKGTTTCWEVFFTDGSKGREILAVKRRKDAVAIAKYLNEINYNGTGDAFAMFLTACHKEAAKLVDYGPRWDELMDHLERVEEV